MGEIFLSGHTGCDNRGCEAIVRSTIDILNKAIKNNQFFLATTSKDQDLRAGIDKGIECIEYKKSKKYALLNIITTALERAFESDWKRYRYQRDVLKNAQKADVTLTIGGDTYCYGDPEYIFYFNRYVRKRGIPNVFWSCSVGEENLNDAKIKDIMGYDMIFPRESITYNNFINIGIPEEKLCKMADSAFVLATESIELPTGLLDKKVVGINANPNLGGKDYKDKLMQERYGVIEYILKETDFNIALIPHVYSKNSGDVLALRHLFEKYKDTNRIYLFDEEYNCMQLKYIISKCSFLVAERTHASIAGYSNCVPTFVVGYSVKSRGIATDIFGSTDDYVIGVMDIKEDNILKKKIKGIIENEDAIRKHLEQMMPDYVKTAWNAGNIIQRFVGD